MKDGADVKLTVRTTRHGPVLSDVSADLASIAEPGKAVALAFTGLGDHDTTAEAMMRLNAARNWGEFLDALKLYQTPTQNIVYADVSGDIGFFSPGLVPLRKSGDGLTPADGASGAFDWIGAIPFDQLPQLHNPEIGFAFNANNANVPIDAELEIWARLGGGFPRAPHSRVLRHDRQAQSGDLGRNAGRPSVARGQGLSTLHREDKTDR